ncbi:MAG: adenylate/guanylate cyclase domain-containing protein [Treponema sp.]|nr:adenylate/guanylate cyclase domain-containing protein [Treponema sp.]
MEKIISFFERFNIPQTFKSEIDKKNRFVLKVLFWIALLFGLIFSISSLFRSADDKFVHFIYYISYLAIGLLGFLLLFLKAPVSLIQGVILVYIEYIVTYILPRTHIETTVLIFFALLFAIIMVMQINPLMFFSVLTVYLILISVLCKKQIIIIPVESSLTFIGNLILSLFVIFYLVFWKRRHVIRELKRDKILADEKEKTEILLNNIFPKKVIRQLKEDGKSPPEMYDNVTVLFADIVDFTKTSSSLDPKVVIDELNEIFTEFDKITEKNGCMRIKTVGDAYLAVCGLPEKNEKHAEQLILCAREYLDFLNKRNEKFQIKWKIRIGIDSGNAIAGIIGLKKYVYDIFGSTVDSAVKIELSCQPMRIAVSENTYGLIKDVLTSREKEEIDLIEL